MRHFAYLAKTGMTFVVACLFFTSCNNRVSRISTTEITLEERKEKVFDHIVESYAFDENLKEEFSSELRSFLEERANELTRSTTSGKLSRKDKKRFLKKKFGEFYEAQLMERGEYVLSDFIARESVSNSFGISKKEPEPGSMLAKIKAAESGQEIPLTLKEQIQQRIKDLETEIKPSADTEEIYTDSSNASATFISNDIPDEFAQLAEKIKAKTPKDTPPKLLAINEKPSKKSTNIPKSKVKKETVEIIKASPKITTHTPIENKTPKAPKSSVKETTTGLFNSPDSGMYFAILTFLLVNLFLGINRVRLA